ncbi:nitroreductase family protein [Pseudoalteromonas sp. A757]|uniref:nitroreductase family protein n=1 Tax=Pseudoalteromonas sp. A757 TaxID=2250709 RepID=UPI000FFE8E24|nr:nitroreductase family protein [Pseudoalteromonas sp. A757]RXE87113.1 NAD(P)H-dependent oxidoreductase [Pseudoalteromonas sp. A757]
MNTSQLESLLNWRYAVRKFSPLSVEQSKVDKLIELTGLSASSYGLQSYKILQITDQKTKQALFPYSYGQQKVVDNSHLLLFAADMSPLERQIDRYMADFKSNRGLSDNVYSQMAAGMKEVLGGMGPEAQYRWCSEQVHLALGTLLVAAASMEIDACPITGIEKKAIDVKLGLAEKQLSTVLVVPLGIRCASDKSAIAPKVRKTQEQLTEEMML